MLGLVGNGEVVSVTSTVGFMTTDDEWITSSNVAQITVDVAERSEARTRPIKEIMEETRRLCANIPGAEIVNYRMISNGPPMDKPVTFRVRGDNYDELVTIADEYLHMLREYESDTGLFNIGHNYDRGYPELQVSVNESRAAQLGLSVAQIGMYIRGCFDGVTATTYFEGDEEVDVIVKWGEQYRLRVEDLAQMKVPAMSGALVPLSTVATINRGRGIATIKRSERTREVTVTADTRNKTLASAVVMPRVMKTFNERYRRAYPAVSLKAGGEWEQFGKTVSDLLRLLGVGIFLMYVILGAQFKSFFQPLIIGASVFFAFIGCVLYLFLSGTPISVVVMFAGVALVGICVNDSIVLISFINELRRKGTSVADAIEEGCLIRLRPILLTSLTTIGGLFPMAVGIGGKSPLWAPMASTIMFGLIFSTVGTLLVIPCFYAIMADIANKFGVQMKLEGE